MLFVAVSRIAGNSGHPETSFLFKAILEPKRPAQVPLYTFAAQAGGLLLQMVLTPSSESCCPGQQRILHYTYSEKSSSNSYNTQWKQPRWPASVCLKRWSLLGTLQDGNKFLHTVVTLSFFSTALPTLARHWLITVNHLHVVCLNSTKPQIVPPPVHSRSMVSCIRSSNGRLD